MPRAKKMICHDCGTLFNRKPQNGDKQICWNCQSMRVTLATDPAPPPVSTIPEAPSPSGLKMPTFKPSTGGGGITPEMLLRQRSQLKKVVRPPVVLPGDPNSPIPKGVRMLAYQIKNPTIRSGGVELELIWRERGSTDDNYAYLPVPVQNLAWVLNALARGSVNPGHDNFNTTYNNFSKALPTRKGPRSTLRRNWARISYFEYGWKTNISPNAKWYGYRNGVRSELSKENNANANAFVRNLRQGQIFTERLIFSETGEVFYTPDHYGTFWRYHPGTMDWYKYQSAGGSAGPLWDESFYEPPTGA